MQPMNTVDETPELRLPWREVMKEQGRKMPWLARRTGKSESTIDAYAYGKLTPPQAWLDKVSDLLGVKVR